MKKKIKINSELALVFAVVLIAFAITFIIKADFGMTVVQAPVQVLSMTVPALSMGVWNYIVQGFLVLLMIVLAQRFKISYIISFIAAIIYGFVLDLIIQLMAGIVPNFFWERIIYYIIGYILLCLSIAIFFTCKAPLMPYDIFVREVTQARKLNIAKFKWIFDISCLLIAVLLSFTITGKVLGLGIGSLIFAFTVSPVVALMMKPINATIEFVPFFKDKEFLFARKKAEETALSEPQDTADTADFQAIPTDEQRENT